MFAIQSFAQTAAEGECVTILTWTFPPLTQVWSTGDREPSKRTSTEVVGHKTQPDNKEGVLPA